MLKLDFSRLACCDVTPVQMIVTVPKSLPEFIEERARRTGPAPAEYGGRLLEDAFVSLAEQEMMELRLDPRTLPPTTLGEAYSGNYDPVTVEELSAMTGLSPAFIKVLAVQGSIPGYESDGQGYGWFYRDEVIPWLLSDELNQIFFAHPEHHVATP